MSLVNTIAVLFCSHLCHQGGGLVREGVVPYSDVFVHVFVSSLIRFVWERWAHFGSFN